MSSIFRESESLCFGENWFFEQKISSNNSSSQKQRISFGWENFSLFSSLEWLIMHMKPSFLPFWWEKLFRQVFLSPAATPFPCFLVKYDSTAILLGMGISLLQKSGKNYQTFPDMRLPVSEKNRIHAWILTENDFDREIFSILVELLDFPPIYATRSVISALQKDISLIKNFSKIRFIEIFSRENTIQKIGDFVLENVLYNEKNCLSITYKDSRFLYDFVNFDILWKNASIEHIFSRNETNFSFRASSCEMWEILQFDGKNFSKNSLKFSLDTFLRDGKNIATESGFFLSDREILAENGVLIFTLEENTTLGTISGHIFIESRGFVHMHETVKIHKEIIKAIRLVYEQNREKNPNIERAELLQILKKEISKFTFILTGKTPIIIPIITQKNL